MNGALFCDAAIAGLAAALEPSVIGPRLDDALRDSGLPLLRPIRVLAAEVLKHKPGRRCSIAYTLQGESAPVRVFAKAFASERGATIAGSMARLIAAVPAELLVVPRPFAYVPELRLLLTEFVEGEPLAASLYAASSEVPARRVAEALVALHACAASAARRWSPQKEIRNTAAWALGTTGRAPLRASRADALLRALESWAHELPPSLETPVHRDFYAEQVFDCGGRVAILDLDDARRGDPAIDVGNFLAHLTLRRTQFPATTAGAASAGRAFLGRYAELRGEDGRGDAFASRVGFYEASALLRLSGVYGARERWTAILPEKLLDACTERVESRSIPQGRHSGGNDR